MLPEKNDVHQNFKKLQIIRLLFSALSEIYTEMLQRYEVMKDLNPR